MGPGLLERSAGSAEPPKTRKKAPQFGSLGEVDTIPQAQEGLGTGPDNRRCHMASKGGNGFAAM